MGFTSVLVINNDFIGDKDKIDLRTAWSAADTDMNAEKHNLRSRTGQKGVQMCWNEHSDAYGLVIVGNIQGKVVASTYDSSSSGPPDMDRIEMELLKKLADKHGMVLHRKSSKRKIK